MTKRERTRCCLLTGVIAIGAVPWMAEGPQARAQDPGEWCDTYEAWVAKVGQRGVPGEECPTYSTCDTPLVRDSWIPEPATPVVTIRIKFNIFCEDDGTNCAASPSDVAGQMTQLNSGYAPYGIQFTQSTAADYIWDSTYRVIEPEHFGDELESMRNQYADDPAHQLNVYVTDLPIGGRATFPWDADVLGNQGGILLDEGYFGASEEVLTHESGHAVGLWHTHHGVSEFYDEFGNPLPCFQDEDPCDCPCYERADGVDGDVTGDFASDTPSTPVWYWCSDPPGYDLCSIPPESWEPTQPENYMSYAPPSCWTLFTPQQAGRMHCWIRDVLMGWVACTTNLDCDDRNECTEDLCVDGVCQNIYQELPGLTCQDGIDNDCDGYADCEDVEDCASDSACYCDDNNGNGPIVCVYWDGLIGPVPGGDFLLTVDPDHPDVAFRTGNDGWVVWSQVDWTDNTPANLGHIGIDHTVVDDDFTVTLAHGESAGAANVASIALVDEGWTGQSNLSNSKISGNLTGDLVLQESAGQGGAASLTVEGDLLGSVTVPRVEMLQVGGAVAGDVTLTNGIPVGASVSINGLLTDTASLDLNGQALGGSLTLRGGSAPQSLIEVGPMTGQLFAFTNPLSGTVIIGSVAQGGSVWMEHADLSGGIYVLGDWEGWLTSSTGAFTLGAVISIDGNLADGGSLSFFEPPGGMAGSLLIGQELNGSIDIVGDIGGNVTVGAGGSGTLNGGTVKSGGIVSLSEAGSPFTGTATFAAVESGGYIMPSAGDLGGLVHITGDMSGTVDLGGNLLSPGGSPGGIQIDGDVGATGTVHVLWNVYGGVDVNGTVVSGGSILVDGDVSGSVDVNVLSGTLDINGDLTGTGSVSVTDRIDGGTLDVDGAVGSDAEIQVARTLNGAMTFDGDVSGSISVSDEMDGGYLVVNGSVGAGADVYIGDMVNAVQLQFTHSGYFAGNLNLPGGLEASQVLNICGRLANTSSVQFGGAETNASVDIQGGADAGSVVNGGAITGGIITLGRWDDFAGTASFDGVEGTVKLSPGDLCGSIIVAGDVDGDIEIMRDEQEQTGGDLLGNGLIQIGGDLYGQVRAYRHLAGEVSVDGGVDASGSIEANYDGVGDGDITGDVAVLGLFDGNICGDNLSPDEVLPNNIHVALGPNATVCGEEPCILAITPTLATGEPGFDKNRYISFVPNNTGYDAAIRVTLTDLPPAFQGYEGEVRWVGQPRRVSESSGESGPTPPTFWAASLECDPYHTDWSDVDVLHVYDEAIVPSATYTVDAIRERCRPDYEPNYSDAVIPDTTLWGDICGASFGAPPNDVVDFTDITAVVEKYKNTPGAPIKSRADVAGELPDQLVDFVDITYVIEAFSGSTYPFDVPQECE